MTTLLVVFMLLSAALWLAGAAAVVAYHRRAQHAEKLLRDLVYQIDGSGFENVAGFLDNNLRFRVAVDYLRRLDGDRQ